MNISTAKKEALEKKMRELGIRECDIVERFIRSSGRGGQNVNKVSTCVYLKHEPTGIEVKCGKERFQALNRFFARRLLFEKIEEKIRGAASEKRRAVEKLRRQKRKRSKRAKEKMLADKKKRSQKKALRKFAGYEER